MSKVIRKFEYDTLYVGEHGFKEKHFESIVNYNDKHHNRFFTIGNKKVVFTSYVGVMQIHDITIEILPKGDRYIDSVEKENKWRLALINLLSECKMIKLKSTHSAYLSIHRNSLLEFYISHFLNEVDEILRHGFMKRYDRREGQKYSLKGALHFPKHVSKNFIHKERFYTTHQVFDYNHPLNQILKTALHILVGMNLTSTLIGKARNLELRMDGVDLIHPSNVYRKKVHFDRRVTHYEDAVQLALMIINEYSPVLKHGDRNIVAFLFDMNKLFEEFILRRLYKEQHNFQHIGLRINGQVKKMFWDRKTIQPDILLTYHNNGEEKYVILDTKWKLLEDEEPSDSDLKQMFVYNLYFSADKSILLYPYNGYKDKSKTAYHASDWVQNESHGCAMKFINPFFEDGRINDSFAKNLIYQIVNN